MRSKISIVLSFLLLTHICTAQKSVSTINWDTLRPLTWADFKGHATNSSSYDALTEGSFSCNFEKVSTTESKLVIQMGFDTKKSWVKPKMATDKLLIHEQGHFDIFEIYTRIFVKKLEEENALSGPKYGDKVKKIFDKNFKELMKLQEKYDKETNHSKNEEKQLEWNVKIKSLLEENKQYARKEIPFKSQ
jgi:hypothetical protein